MTEEKRQSLHSISRSICEVYNNLLAQGEVAFTLQDMHADNIDSIVKTVEGTYFNITSFSRPEEKASAYFCLLIKNHPVIDGNKRLAVLWLETYCKAMGLVLKNQLPFGLTLDILAVSVEQTKNIELKALSNAVSSIIF